MLKSFKEKTLVVLLLTSVFMSAQDRGSSRGSKYNFNTWSIGAGINNTLMYGDLADFSTSKGKKFINIGGYLYANKMFNPIVGVEMKISSFSDGSGREIFSKPSLF